MQTNILNTFPTTLRCRQVKWFQKTLKWFPRKERPWPGINLMAGDFRFLRRSSGSNSVITPCQATQCCYTRKLDAETSSGPSMIQIFLTIAGPIRTHPTQTWEIIKKKRKKKRNRPVIYTMIQQEIRIKGTAICERWLSLPRKILP